MFIFIRMRFSDINTPPPPPKYRTRHDGGLGMQWGNSHIRPEQAYGIYDAIWLSHKNKTPLNRFITILTKDNSPQAVWKTIRENMDRWCDSKKNNMDFDCLWFFEKGELKGEHIHLMLHMPAGDKYRRFKNYLGDILDDKYKIDPIEYRTKSRDLYFSSIGQHNPNYAPNDINRQLAPVLGLAKYLCKGIEPDTALNYIPRQHRHYMESIRETEAIRQHVESIRAEYQGHFYCQRCGGYKKIIRKAQQQKPKATGILINNLAHSMRAENNNQRLQDEYSPEAWVKEWINAP